eukprot:5236440-Amphidinium_carterae.2
MFEKERASGPQGIDRRACGGALGMVELGLVPVVGQNLSDGDGEVATFTIAEQGNRAMYTPTSCFARCTPAT